MLDVAFVNTKYQLEVLLDVAKVSGLNDLLVLAPSELAAVSSQYDVLGYDFLFFDGLNDRLNFRQSRALISEIKYKLSTLKGAPVRFWLANDDHVLAQIFVRYANVCDIVLFEDGFGSYVKHKPMFLDMGVKAVISKIKKIIFFAPYYRSLHRFGGNFKATKCYSYNKGCFPKQGNVERVVIKKSLRTDLVVDYIPDGSVYVVGQPLVEAGLISVADYKKILLSVVKKHCPTCHVFYKPHPSESEFIKGTDGDFELLKSDAPAEHEIACLNAKVVVLGFYSTVLMNCVSNDNVKCVKAIRSVKLKVSDSYYEALSRAGCEIIDF